MRSGLLFAILGAVSSALWTTFHFEAASKVHPIIGATIVSIVASSLGAIFLLFQYQVGMGIVSKKGLLLLVLVGVAAFSADYFALRTFASDIQLSIGGPILIGGSVALTAIIGLFMGEAITLQTMAGIIFITIGAALLGTIIR